MKLSDLLNKLEQVRTEGSSYLARCPAHSDSHPSLILTLQEDGKLLIHCRAGCSKTKVLNALDLQMSDLFDIDADIEDAPIASAGPPSPPTAAHIQAATDYCNRANSLFKDSPGSLYAAERFGIDPDFGFAIGLGYDPGNLAFEWLTPAYREAPRLVVPFLGADEIIRGLQARALDPQAKVRWCGPQNPPGHRWATLGIFDFWSENDSNILITEGPGDALTALGHQTGAILIRGAALARNGDALSTLLAVTHGRRIILAGDNDESGLDFNLTLGSKLAAEGRQVHTLQIEQGGDLTDWRAHAGEEFREDFSKGLRAATRIDVEQPPPPPPPVDEADFFDPTDPLYAAELTDEGNAQRLASTLGNDWRYTSSLGWLRYERGAWERNRIGIGRATAMMLLNLRALGMTLVEVAENQDLDDAIADFLDERGHALIRWSKVCENSPKFERVHQRCAELVDMPHDDFDEHDHLLVTNNGNVDLRTGEMTPHEPLLYMTHRVEFDYDPQAKAPRWEQFLDEVTLGRPELTQYLQTLIGYSISGSTAESILVVFHGGGANGKSVFLNAIRHVFEDLTGVAAYSTFEKKNGQSSTADLAAIAEKRLVLAQEGERNAPMNEALLKRATGGDPLTVRHLYQDHFTFVPKWKLILATNYRPRLRGTDDGLWRRIKLVPWDAQFLGANRDTNLREKLEAEAEGILAWAVEGAIRYYTEGLTDPPVIEQGMADYRDTSDELAGFVDMVVTQTDDGDVSGKDVYEAFRDWAMEEGIKPMSRQALFAAVSERFPDVRKKKTKFGVHFDGISLRGDE
jgi:putative DNA primase/helicase